MSGCKSWMGHTGVLASFLAVLLSACGGGGGGGGSAAPPATGATLTANYYPVNSGDRRTWRTVGGAFDGQLRHELIGHSVSLAAGTALEVRGANGVTDYLQPTEQAITSLPGPGSDPLSAAVGPLDRVRFGVSVGQATVLVDRTVSADVDADGRADSVTLRVESTFVGLETVTTPAGTFVDAAHVRTVVGTLVRLATTGMSVTVTLTSDDWLAAGVGPVRSSSTTAADGAPAQTDVEELMAYGVGARHSETAPPTLLSSTPAADSAYGNSLPLTFVFSERLDPLSLDGSGGLRLLDAAGVAVAADRRVDASGTQLTYTPTSPLPDGRYTLQSGGSVTDLAGNPLSTAPRAFFVDTRGPRLVSSTPSEGAADVPLTGSLVLNFDEPLVPAVGNTVQVSLTLFPDPSGGLLLPGTVSGNTLTVPIVTPLLRNREYLVQLASPIGDALGNPPLLSSSTLRFRTDPGALARPVATLDGADVSVVRLADWNGDGRPDLVFGAQQLGSSVQFIAVRLALAGGGFAPAQRLTTFPEFFGCGLVDVVVIDADGDGRRDLVAYSDCAVPPLVLLLQQADGSFLTERPALDLTSQQIGTLDLDGDGREELVVAQPAGLRFLQRDAGGNWQEKGATSAGNFIVAWQFADLDGDGRQDLVWVQASADNAAYELAWALRVGSGFGPVQHRALPVAVSSPPRLTVGDLDNDGRADIVLTLSSLAGTQSVAVLSQDAMGQFGNDRLLATAPAPVALSVADMDGDGRLDLVVAHATGSGLGVYLQGGDGQLQAERVFEATYGNYSFARSLALADVDGNGRIDVVVDNDIILSRFGAAVSWPLQAPRVAGAAGLRTRGASWTQRDLLCRGPSSQRLPALRCASSNRSGLVR